MLLLLTILKCMILKKRLGLISRTMRAHELRISRFIRSHSLRYCDISSQHRKGCRTLSHYVGGPVLRSNFTASVMTLESKRSAKTKSTVKLKDLPQGALKLAPYDDGSVDDAPRYPAVLQGHLNNMQKFKNCIVLTRVGGFYEVGFLFCICTG